MFIRSLLLGLILLLLNSCSDPFGMTVKEIQGKYYIQEFDEALPATYYVIEKGVSSGGGVFDGIIRNLAWVDNELFADVKRLSSGDVSGWYKLDLKSGIITGPVENNVARQPYLVSVEDFYKDPQKYFHKTK